MRDLDVRVYPSHEHDRSQTTNDMVLVAEITDGAGAPVTGLEAEHFECWQLGIYGLGQIRIQAVSHLGRLSPSLAGIYHVIPRWSVYTESQIVFTLLVRLAEEDGDELVGRGTATLVTQGEQD